MALKDLPTPFRTDSEEEVRFAVAKFFSDLGFTEQELSLEDHFHIRLGHTAFRIDGKDHKGRLIGRSDILISRHGKNLAIVETKGPDHKLTIQDAEQAVSYARLLRQIAPYAIVTNGIQTKVYDVIQFVEIHTPTECIWHQNGQQYSVIGQQARDDAAKHLFQFSPEIANKKAPLGLTGYLSALSKEPPTKRAFIDRNLVGHDEAMDWLRNTPGDKLLVGQPGAGKTSLLYQLSKDEEQGALFVRTKNELEIAVAIREISPKILMLDDVFNDHEFVEQMMRLRNDPKIDGDFSLIATCWNGDREEFLSILETPDNNALALDRLTQDQMVEVIASVGITQNTWLINEIIRQAAGLPGFAVTMVDLALRGEGEKIRTAEALSTTIIRFYKQVIEGPVKDILACFALGGKSGMHKNAVSGQLGLTRYELREALENLETGGIVAEVQNRRDHIKVRPDALRHALIRDVFLSGPSSLSQSDLKCLIDKSADPKATAMELVEAKARGGKFDVGFLESYLGRLEDNLWQDYQQALAAWPPEAREAFGVTRPVFLAQQNIHHVWGAFAAQGYDEASWVIENFTGRIALLALPLLHHVPQSVIPRLLTEAVGDNRALNAHPSHPMRLLQDWVQSAYPATAETVRRRRALLRGARKWLENGYDPIIGYKTMTLAMTPHYEDMVTKPGSGNAGIWRERYLTEPELYQLQPFWQEIIEVISVIEVPDWKVFLDTISDWAFPVRGQNTPEKTEALMTSFAIEMALDVKEAASNHRGVLRSLKSLMQRSYPDLDIIEDDVLDALYPTKDLESDWKTQEENWTHAVDELADSWINRGPHEVIAELESIELELNQQWPRLTPDLCYRLAEKTPEPLLWFDLMLPTALTADTIMPFLEEASRRPVEGWEQALRSSFETERLRGRAFQIILTHPHVPDDLNDAAWSIAGQCIGEVRQMLWSNRLTQETILKFFSHPDKPLVGMLAVKVWQHNKRAIADNIRTLWEQAIIEHHEGDYWLGEIFKVEPDLAMRWFKQRFDKDSLNPSYEFSSEINDILATWSVAHRRNLLAIIPDAHFDNDLIAATIGDDLELYELLLQQVNRNKSALLSPLHRPIDTVWQAFAKVAYLHGHSPHDIVALTFARIGSVMLEVGRSSNTWKSWRDQFEVLRGHEDEIIREIAEVGYQRSDKRYKEELDKERDEDVHGRD